MCGQSGRIRDTQKMLYNSEDLAATQLLPSIKRMVAETSRIQAIECLSFQNPDES